MPEVSERMDIWLAKKGFIPADSDGFALKGPLASTSLGLLLQPAITQKRSWWRFFTPTSSRLWVASIWWGNGFSVRANSTNWVVRVFGREYLPKITKLAREIEDTFHVQVKVELASEYPQSERFPMEI